MCDTHQQTVKHEEYAPESSKVQRHHDVQHRTPLELTAEELRAHLHFSKPGDVYTWGSGANYQLGTGSAETHALPTRLEVFSNESVVSLAAAKFHSCVVTKDGRLFTWGWGRGGRLGHAGFDGDAQQKQKIMAQIHPCEVAGLSRLRVTGVAAAKHHTLACTADGHVFAWGSNKHGRLGVSGVDSVHTPRRVSGFKHEVVSVAAANKHSGGLSASGRLYTWGDNTQGQLGYGTSGKAFNTAPRIVESVRDRHVAAASLSKRHTVVLTSEGDVLSWGHKVRTACSSIADRACWLASKALQARAPPPRRNRIRRVRHRDRLCRCCPPTKVSLHGCRDTARSAKALRLLDRHQAGRANTSSSAGAPAGSHAHAPRAPRAPAAVPLATRSRARASTSHRDNADVVNPARRGRRCGRSAHQHVDRVWRGAHIPQRRPCDGSARGRRRAGQHVRGEDRGGQVAHGSAHGYWRGVRMGGPPGRAATRRCAFHANRVEWLQHENRACT